MLCCPDNKCDVSGLPGNTSTSVFEVDINPNGLIQGTLARENRTFDDIDLLGNPPAYRAETDIDFDFSAIPFSDPAQLLQQPSSVPQQQQGVVDTSQIQNFDWIAAFLNASGGAVPQGPQPQAATEPVPNPAQMDATWQAMVQQLGLNM